MGCFLTVATFETKLSKSVQMHLLIVTIILGILHLTFELRQFIHSPKHWVQDFWNYCGAMLFPIITSFYWLLTSTIPIWAVTISTLLLELKFLSFFRNIEIIGAYFAMIIGVAKNAFSFLVILGFIIVAFAHSLHILLTQTTDLSNDQNNSVVSNSTSGKVIATSSNIFVNFITAIFAVYMMLTGDSSYLSDWSLTENPTLAILIVCFSFFTTIYLMNLFIGLLSDFIDKTNKKELFLLQRAKFLVEIELFYMLPHQRRKNNWFPELIFHLDKLYDLIKKVQNDKWEEPYEAPFISDTLKKVTKFKSDVETYSKKDIDIDINIDINKITEDIQKLKTNEKAIQKLRDLLNKEL
ncbi:hypothetical protein C2G38_2234837 [Gigaspora rosea]|uniref:Ion transport domain-containing protein n=1 Tax=Gigaspora rosea TaxID=44941 RepID=A0A397TQ25_9GLOM|nr:hypothetical protein C2G38_2234837 [Gigaspora rosea]